MNNKLSQTFSVFVLTVFLCFDLSAKAKTETIKNTQQVYQLSYIEREPGTDEYETIMLVSDQYIRIDEVGENSGFIIYDDNKKIIYSVSHHDESVLVIKEHDFLDKDSPVTANVEYLQLADAPQVSGKDIYNYRVFVKGPNGEEVTCTELQLVEGLLPGVRKLLQNYQKVVSGQQVKMVDNNITVMQPACFFADQIYNTGAYYEKGLPIQEWHSNERFKLLTGYEEVSVSNDKFVVPVNYRRFSVSADKKPLFE